MLVSRAALVGHRPLFSSCTTRGHYGRSQIGYNALRDLLLRQLEEIGLPRSSFGTHSLRAGGATMAANIAVELGIPDRLWHEHGGWRSVQAAQGYVVTSRELKLKTTRSMLCVLLDGGLPAGAHGPPPPLIHLPRTGGYQDENV